MMLLRTRIAVSLLCLVAVYTVVTAAGDTSTEASVVVLFDVSAFAQNCVGQSSEGSSSSSGGSSSGSPPVVYVEHGPLGIPWQFSPMRSVWWNSSIVAVTIPQSHQFVVLCIGAYIHCDATSPANAAAGVCVDGGNFLAASSADAILVLPSAKNENASALHGDGYGVIAPYCPLSLSLWASATLTPDDAFVPRGQRCLDRPLGNVSASTMFAPCNSNGNCFVNKNDTLGGAYTARCVCNQPWRAADCGLCCDCPERSEGSVFCAVTGGGCATDSTAATSTAPNAAIMSQGVTVVLLSTQWYGTTLFANQTYIRYNAGNLTSSASFWENINFSEVDVNSSRLAFFASGGGIGNHNRSLDHYTARTPAGNPLWMFAVVPGNLVQFVPHSAQINDFLHCHAESQRLSYAASRWADPRLSNMYACIADHVNDLDNFVSTSGVVQVTQTSFNMLGSAAPGCQYGYSNVTANEVAVCSGRGVCDEHTYFTCQCFGNFTGVACEMCNCQSNERCDELGQCTCPKGYAVCALDDALPQASGCVNVMNDTGNCGACANDCFRGIRSAVKSAQCVDGQCHVEMVAPLEWEVCFGADDSGDGDSGASADSSLSGSQRSPISCFKGYDFLIVFLVSLPLVVVSLVAFLRLRIRCPRTHQHRQALFVLLTLVGGLRLVYAIIALLFLVYAKTPDDAVRSRQFFAATMITLNAYADLFSGFIDVLLTVFWLFVLDRLHAFPKRLLLMTCAGMATTLTVATIVDYTTDHSTFDYTFFTIAILLFFTALMHMTVIVEVLLKFLVWWRAEERRDSSSFVTTAATSTPSNAAANSKDSNGTLKDESGGSRRTILADDAEAASTVARAGGTSERELAKTSSGEASPRRWRSLVSIQEGAPAVHAAGASAPSAPRVASYGAQIHAVPIRTVSSNTPPPAFSSSTVAAHFIRVTLIAVVCLLCWMVRSVMLLGRATKNPVFFTGALSFANPLFTLLYLTVLTLLPCILIAIIFVELSFDVLRQGTTGIVAHNSSFASGSSTQTEAAPLLTQQTH